VEERLLKILAKYEIGVALDKLTTEAIMEYLKALVMDTSKELDLEQLFGKLRFDLTSKEPGAIVGDVFQKVKDLLEDNNIVDHFPEKVICRYIVEAVYPVELRKRVEYHISITAGKQKKKALVSMHRYPGEMYDAWFALHPAGYTIAAAARKTEAKVGADGGRRGTTPRKQNGTGRQARQSPTVSRYEGSRRRRPAGRLFQL
jgi:hypothetical protein